VADDADEASPGEALLFTEGGADVREDDEGVGDAALAEGTAVDHPASGLFGARAHARRGSFELNDGFGGSLGDFAEEIGESQFPGGFAEVPGGLEAEDALGGGVEEAEARVLIEGKDGCIHFSDDATEQGDSFEGGDALGLESVGKGVDFEGELAEGVVAGGSTGAERVVLFAEGGDDVGEGLNGANGFFNEGGEDEQQDESEDGDGSEQRSGGDVKKGEQRGGEADDGESRKGTEDAQAYLEGNALAGGLAR
jgi:hypothetical protein